MSASATDPALTAADSSSPEPGDALSTDYLNRYSEALMLLEMTTCDRSMLAELKAWRAVGYLEHFRQSRLRCADEAQRAYRALGAAQAERFEELCTAMNRLVATVSALLDDVPEQDVALVVEVAARGLRRLIGQAATFINANGRIELARVDADALQAEIDRLLAS